MLGTCIGVFWGIAVLALIYTPLVCRFDIHHVMSPLLIFVMLGILVFGVARIKLLAVSVVTTVLFTSLMILLVDPMPLLPASALKVFGVFSFVVASGVVCALAAGRYAKASFTSNASINPAAWCRAASGTFLGVLVGLAVFYLTCRFAWFILQTVQPNREWALVLLGSLFPILATFFVCALYAGNYARVKISGLANDSSSAATLKPSVGFLMITHATPLVLLLLCLEWLVVPVLMDMWMSFCGGLPWPTRFCWNVSCMIRYYWLLVLPGTAALLWGDVRVYAWIHSRGHRLGALIWLWGISCSLVSLILLVVIVMFLPIFKVGELVGK